MTKLERLLVKSARYPQSMKLVLLGLVTLYLVAYFAK
jgi:hypothetical protein